MKKIPLFFYILSVVILSSCASLLNSETQKIFIDHDSTVAVQIDSSFYLNITKHPAWVPKDISQPYHYFYRCSSPIALIDKISGDSIKIKPHKDYFAYWFGNIYMSMGLGMIIDNKSNRRFEYPKYIYLTRSGDKIKNIRFKPIREKKVKFSIGLPYINNFVIQTDSGKISSAGFWGISMEIAYFLKNQYSISLNAGGATDFFLPFPAAVDFYGEVPFSRTNYVNLRLNKTTPRIEYGLGISYSRLNWETRYFRSVQDSIYVYPQRGYQSDNIGLAGSFQYRFSKVFKTGLLFQPAIFDLYHRRFNYQHVLSVELTWRF